MPEDRPSAIDVAERLLAIEPAPTVCAGGAAGELVAPGVRTLDSGFGAAVEQLDELLGDV
jgi:hypothetical protein